MTATKRFIQAWQQGFVCLHPTDTIPGLSFNPRSNEGLQRFCDIKGRRPDKTTICLLASVELAKTYWLALPAGWQRALSKGWPAGLSLIWYASSRVPESLVRDDGTIAFRVPQFSDHDRWMSDVLTELQIPFPTSSVNQSGEPSAACWSDAVKKLDGLAGIYIPNDQTNSESVSNKAVASTLIRICEDDQGSGYQIIREGSFDERNLKTWLMS